MAAPIYLQIIEIKDLTSFAILEQILAVTVL